MARLKNDAESSSAPKERTTSEKLQDVIGEFNAAQATLESKKDARDALFSEVAKNLIENHKGAPIIVGGVKYAPKKSSTRKVDGVDVAPKYPFTLVTKNEKPTVDLG